MNPPDDASPETSSETSSETIAPEFLEMLVCPRGKAPLTLEAGRLVCTRCGVSFEIRDGIPQLIPETGRLPEGVDSEDDLPCQREEETSPP